MQQLDLFLDCFVRPVSGEMEPLDEHERSHLAITLLLNDHVFDNVLPEVRMLEYLLLRLGEEE